MIECCAPGSVRRARHEPGHESELTGRRYHQAPRSMMLRKWNRVAISDIGAHSAIDFLNETNSFGSQLLEATSFCIEHGEIVRESKG